MLSPQERTSMELRAKRTVAEIIEDIKDLEESRRSLDYTEPNAYVECMLNHPEEDVRLSDEIDTLSVDELMDLIEEVII